MSADPAPTAGTFRPSRSGRWWLAYHTALAPFGVLATTWLLTGAAHSRHWTVWKHLNPAGDMLELGAVVYAALAVLVEGGIRVVFRAIEQWRRDKERRAVEAQNRALDELMVELRVNRKRTWLLR